VRFSILAAPGSDPGEARARATALVPVVDRDDVAIAARASDDPYLLLLEPGATLRAGALGGVRALLDGANRVIGGAAHRAGGRHYGWMLAPLPAGPIPFEPVAIVISHGEAGVEAQLRGPIDVPAPGMVMAARSLLVDPLPVEQLAAWLELAERARAAGGEVMCLPSFAWSMRAEDSDDRGRWTALRAIADARPTLIGRSRLPAGIRRRIVEREVRFDGGLRRRVRMPLAPLTVLVHGRDAERLARGARALPSAVQARAIAPTADALRDELRVRGERNVLVCESSRLPDAGALADLLEQLENAPFVAAVAPDASSLDGTCVLLAAGRFPAHVQPAGEDLADGLRSLLEQAQLTGRAVRAPGHVTLARPPEPGRPVRVVFLAGSTPEVLKTTFDAALAATRRGDDVVAVTAVANASARAQLAASTFVEVLLDAGDPLLTDAANRALAQGDGLVFLLSDDVLIPTGTLDRLRAAFARIPALGAAVPSIPESASTVAGEAVADVGYADLGEMRAQADERGRTFARECTPIDVAATPAVVFSREALDAVGGIDPLLGPTRRGVADLIVRVRAAGYAVVRCDDTLAHRFDASTSRNPAAAADLVQPLITIPDRAAQARGFEPVRRVPFERDRLAPADARCVVIVPLADEGELERALGYVSALAARFDARTPLRADILVDGELQLPLVAARVRVALVAGGRPVADAVAVRIDRVHDLRAWREQVAPDVRLVVAAGHQRDALADVETCTADELDALVQATR
jgi:hypothetical protein